MGGSPSARPRLVLAAAAAALAALLWRVAVEPVDFGYIRYLAIADEMARSGDWVVMRLVDHIYLDKPPLFFWPMAPIIAALGEAPGWVAHVPDLLALALALLCVHRLGAAIYGRGEPALAAALVFATTWETFNQATGKRLDLLFAALLTAALTAFYLGAGARAAPRPRQLALAWIALALATLTKGPLAILLFAIVTVPWAATTGRLRAFTSGGSLAGVALFVALCSAWPVLLVARLGADGALRALRETDLATRTGDLLLYARNLPLLQLPWSLFYPALAVWLWRERPWRTSEGVRFVAIWAAAILAVLHVPDARHQRYLQPVTPALGLLVTGLWFAAPGTRPGLAGPAARLVEGASAALLGILALAGAVAGTGLLLLDREPLTGAPLPPERWLAGPLAIAVAAGALRAIASLRRRGSAWRGPAPIATLLLGALACASLLAAGELRRKDPTPLARAALAPVRAGRPAALLGMHEEQQQMGRLLTRRHLPLLPDAAAAAAWAAEHGEAGALVLTDEAGRRARLRSGGVEVRILRDFDLAQERIELLDVRPGS